MRILRKLLLFPLLILIFAMIVAGCSQKTPADVRIELETPDRMMIIRRNWIN